MRAWCCVALSVVLGLAGLGQGCVLTIAGGGLEGRYLAGVPDVSQPPPNPLGFLSVDNWSGPLAAASAIASLGATVGGWPRGVSGNTAPDALSAYLGYFMATNGQGSPDRANAALGLPGTIVDDLASGIREFAWSAPPRGLYWTGRLLSPCPPQWVSPRGELIPEGRNRRRCIRRRTVLRCLLGL
ncbi:MAG: hypothetical protein NUV94_03505 [Candidatus Acetothermia bacterium]|nr:hypothetical protein [Candidatus Acetothermia bacterium]